MKWTPIQNNETPNQLDAGRVRPRSTSPTCHQIQLGPIHGISIPLSLVIILNLVLSPCFRKFLTLKVRLNLGILDWERNPLLWRSFLPKSINKCQESHCSQSSIDELILVVWFILPLGVPSPRVRVSAETFIVPQHLWRILPSMNSKFRVGLERAYVTLLASSHFFTTQYLATHNKVAPTIKIPH